MKKFVHLFFSLFTSSLAFTTTGAWVRSLRQNPKTHPRTMSSIQYSNSNDYLDRPDAAQPLPLSSKDLERFTEMHTRGTTMPVIIMATLLPGQKLYFQSADPKFEEMIKYVLSSGEGSEIGIIGLNPHSGGPLNFGVTATVRKTDMTFGIKRNSERILATSFKGKRRFEVVGEPWMDPTHSFYIANVEIIDNRQEFITEDLERQAMAIHEKIPGMVREWVKLIVKADRTTPAELSSRLKEIGPMPKVIKDRAIWVAALLNPIPPLGVCAEIRPAMLACRNDHDRMVLASTALASSMDHLSGKQN